MFKFLSKRKSFFFVVGLIHFGLLATWVLLGEYHRVNAPFSPISETGHIYSLAYHGQYAYLTWNEYAVYWGSFIGCGINFIVASIIDDLYFRKNEVTDWRNPKIED